MWRKIVKCERKFKSQSSCLLYNSVRSLVYTCEDTGVSNAQRSAHTTNYCESRGRPCGHHKSAAPTVSRPRTIVVVLGTCLALSVSLFQTGSTDLEHYIRCKACAQHDDGSGPRNCRCSAPMIYTTHTTALAMVRDVRWAPCV